jgi:HEAT repeat protein
MKEFFDTEGEVLFYFYGHGCMRDPGLGVLGTSDAQPDDEGVLMSEVIAFAQKSKAREIILVLDCCHAGATMAVDSQALNKEVQTFIEQPGRAILAACADHQQGWEAQTDQQKALGAFSAYVLDGIQGVAQMPGRGHVRASSLSNYITDEFKSWKQNPICLTHETGERSCIITSGLEIEIPAFSATHTQNLWKRLTGRNPAIETLRIGLPFKPSTNFVGRSAEIDYLKSMLIGGQKPIAVSATVEGLGGIGKTELVLQLLYDPEISSAFATIVWLDGAGPLLPQWEQVASELELASVPQDPAKLITNVGKSLRMRGNALIVLDNATDWSPVEDMIPLGLPLLVTTRTRDFGGSSFSHTELGILSDDAAIDFLTQLIPSISSDPALLHLIKLLGGHALALEIAGYHIKDLCSTQEYVRRLLENQAEFSAQVVGKTHYQGTIDSCLAISWDSLRHDESRLLWKKASLFAPTSAHRDLLHVSFVGGESREIHYLLEEYYHYYGGKRVSSVIGTVEGFDAAYAELRGCHILSRVEGYNGERWAMHRLVRDFARKRLQKYEIMIHAFSLADWLRNPTLSLDSEIPHFVAVILDAARESISPQFGERFAAREIFHRAGPLDFSSEAIVRFVGDQLNDPKALTLILAGLTDINEDVRIAAIRLLENIGPIPEVLESLAAALDDPEPQVRDLAARTLAAHGGDRTIAILKEAVATPNMRARLTAMIALGLMGQKAHAALIDVLGSSDENVKIEAATLLCEQGREEGADVVLTSLSSGRGDALLRMIRALASVRKKSAVKRFCECSKKLLEEQEVTVRLETVRALGSIGKPAHSALIDALQNDNEQVRTEAAIMLCKQGRKEGADMVLTLLSLAPSGKFQEMIDALASVKEESVVSKFHSRLIDMLSSSDANIRLHAAMILFEQNRSEGAHAILDSIPTINEWEIDKYLDALSSLNDQSIVSKFLNYLGSDDLKYRRAAAKYFRQVNAHEAVPGLVSLLKDKDSVVRQQAARALGSIGDPAVRKDLANLASKDADVEVRRAANYALKQLKEKA